MLAFASICLAMAPASVQATGEKCVIAVGPAAHHTRWTWKQHGDLEPLTSVQERDRLMLMVVGAHSGIRVYWDREVACTENVRVAPGSKEPLISRSFDRMRSSVTACFNEQGLLESQVLELESKLAERQVQFRELADAEGYSREFVDGLEECPTELRDLAPSYEALVLLPPGPVSVGDRWRVDIDEFSSILLPGGMPAFGIKEKEVNGDNLLYAAALSDLARDAAYFAGDYAGICSATFAGIVTFEGRELAQVDLDFFAESSCPWNESFCERIGFAEEDREDYGVRIESQLRGGGRLFWNLSRGRLESLELKYDAEHELVIDAGWGGLHYSLGIAFRGSHQLDLEARAVPHEVKGEVKDEQ